MSINNTIITETMQHPDEARHFNPSEMLGDFAFEVEKYNFEVKKVISREVDERYRWYAVDINGVERRITKHAGVVMTAYFDGMDGDSFGDFAERDDVKSVLEVSGSEMDGILETTDINYSRTVNSAGARRRTFELEGEDGEKPTKLRAQIGAVAMAYLAGKDSASYNHTQPEYFIPNESDPELGGESEAPVTARVETPFSKQRHIEVGSAVDKTVQLLVEPFSIGEAVSTAAESIEITSTVAEVAPKAPQKRLDVIGRIDYLRAMAFLREGHTGIRITEIVQIDKDFRLKSSKMLDLIMSLHQVEELSDEDKAEFGKLAEEVDEAAWQVANMRWHKTSKARLGSYVRKPRQAKGIAYNRSAHRQLEQALDTFHSKLMNVFYDDELDPTVEVVDESVFEDMIFELDPSSVGYRSAREERRRERIETVSDALRVPEFRQARADAMKRARNLAHPDVTTEELVAAEKAHYDEVEAALRVAQDEMKEAGFRVSGRLLDRASLMADSLLSVVDRIRRK